MDLIRDLQDCRAATLDLVGHGDPELWFSQPHPQFSPIGWHVGHIAYTEALWLLPDAGRPALGNSALFRADGLPKAERGEALPSAATLLVYLAEVRSAVLHRLEQADWAAQAQVGHFILQHESQHAETIALARQLLCWPGEQPPLEPVPVDEAEALEIPAGRYWIGHEGVEALDNEQPSYEVDVTAFRLGAGPVTQGVYERFIAAGGYHQPSWWSPEGWSWRQTLTLEQPRYWQPGRPQLPVCGVSYYEAEACCRFLGKRLPTEVEWEAAMRTPSARRAAGRGGMLGQVWEWTASWFAPYPGFRPFPYAGYSAAYFDQAHRVLRGGSWVTRPWARRPSFRNWYAPDTREIFAGFRWAESL